VALLLIQELRPNRAAQRKKKIRDHPEASCTTHDTHVGVDGFTKLQGYAIEPICRFEAEESHCIPLTKCRYLYVSVIVGTVS
jgi:hypothetical protein